MTSDSILKATLYAFQLFSIRSSLDKPGNMNPINFLLALALLTIPTITAARSAMTSNYTVLYQWNEPDFAFSTLEEREEWIRSKQFIPKNNQISGIKVLNDTIFLTVHRWRPGVPATLVRLPYDSSVTTTVTGAKLVPYPSWELNRVGDCRALQDVNSIEIDQFGRMWAVDIGRLNVWTPRPYNRCPPKILLIDLKSHSVIQSYEFPPQVVNRTTNMLNDIAVGCTTEQDCWAYITDSVDARIIAYSLRMNRAWFVEHFPSMGLDPMAINVRFPESNITVMSTVDGVALSPIDTGFATLFYSPIASFNLYKVRTALIQERVLSSQFGISLDSDDVTNLGHRQQTDGMMADANGVLYYGQLPEHAVYKWDPNGSAESKQVPIVQSPVDLEWPVSFAIDEAGHGFVTTSCPRLEYNRNDMVQRVVRFHVGARNYMYPSNKV